MGSFDASAYEQKPEYDNSPLPVGDYYLEIESAIVKETANGKGVGCNVVFNVLGDVHTKEHSGRKVFSWYTLQHQSDLAQTIGQDQFHELRCAIGNPTLNDTDLLIGGNFVATIGIDKKEPTRNQIKKAKSLEGYKAPAAKPAGASAPTPAAAPAAKAANPWD